MTEEATATQENVGSQIVIAHALPEDAEAILKLKQAAWLDTYVNEELGVTRDDIYAKLTDEDIAQAVPNWQHGIADETLDGQRYLFVAKKDGKVVGFTSPLIEDDGSRRLSMIYVAPDSQREGVGRKLMQRALEWLGSDHDIYLDVLEYNHNAIDFYRHFGFIETGKKIPAEPDREQDIKLLPEIEMMRPKQSA